VHRKLWLIITCTPSRVTTAVLLSIHTASRVYSISPVGVLPWLDLDLFV